MAVVVEFFALAARARRCGGVGSQRGARTGRAERSVSHSSAARSAGPTASARSSRSRPSTERPSARRVNLRHCRSRSTSSSPQSLQTCSAASAMWPANRGTRCLVNTGCRARRRGNHSSCGRTNRLPPSRRRNSIPSGRAAISASSVEEKPQHQLHIGSCT